MSDSKHHYIHIRGIYATALSCLLCKRNFRITRPSDNVRRRLEAAGLPFYDDSPDIYMNDREDRQGVHVIGEFRKVMDTVVALRDASADIVWFPSSKFNDYQAEVLFPGFTKRYFDRVRSTLTPTIRGHHLLRLVDSDRVDEVEKDLHQNYCVSAGKDLEYELIWKRLDLGTPIRLEHMKPNGRCTTLRPGVIDRIDKKGKSLIVRRTGFEELGEYEGLEVAREKGDFDLVEIKSGSWSYAHHYYRKDFSPKGIYINANTPLELYPGLIRYVDLELDLVIWPDQTRKIVDKRDLDESTPFLTPQLKRRTYRILEHRKRIVETVNII